MIRSSCWFGLKGAALVFLVSCAGRAERIEYGAARERCVEEHDAAAEARDCMRDVDRQYGQDGGLSK